MGLAWQRHPVANRRHVAIKRGESLPVNGDGIGEAALRGRRDGGGIVQPQLRSLRRVSWQDPWDRVR